MATALQHSRTRKKAILAMIAEGKSYKQIAAEVGCHFSWAWKVSHPTGGRRITEQTRGKIRRDLSTRLYSLRQIATRHGVAPETVRVILHRDLPYLPNSVRPHRCPTCHAKITSTKCVTCCQLARR